MGARFRWTPLDTDKEVAVTRINMLVGLAFSGLAFASGTVRAQAAGAKPHTIVIQLVERSGPKPFAFEPATFTATRGDTLRFVQAASAIHNVRFKTHPSGSKLGGATTGPYLTGKGEAYNLIVDGRFSEGTYEIVCDPHEAIGMHAFLTVAPTSTP